MKSRHLKICLAIFLVFALSGCHSYLKRRQLERVAKDWALTIRASQVIPVYPLTYDLQPGDIFLVQTPIGKETKIYEEKGFLPIDMQYARLDLGNTAYSEFYKQSYWEGDFAKCPFPRPRRKDPTTGNTIGKMDVSAPSAAFPNYTFEIQTGAGLQLAIPISSIPVGLGLMEAKSASVSVDLKEAFTYGLSIEKILPKLDHWVSDNRSKLAGIVLSSNQDIFLRIVTRVYMVGKVNVTIKNAETQTGGLDVGKSQNIDLLALKTDDPAKLEAVSEAYKKASGAYSDLLKNLSDNLPGGSIRIAQASRGFVTLVETFDEPKVIGYVGFDVIVNKDGSIGEPIPTFAKLEKYIKTPDNYGPDENSIRIEKWLENIKNIDKLKNWLDSQGYKQAGIGITNVIKGSYPALRKEIVEYFKIPPIPK